MGQDPPLSKCICQSSLLVYIMFFSCLSASRPIGFMAVIGEHCLVSMDRRNDNANPRCGISSTMKPTGPLAGNDFFSSGSF